ncbi:MAG: VCBS repeat-containing protein [Deltaproteobacteria bacterium]|nr:VCBS repeat-containing protein [Deltaproteobacteria bacterium]
MRHPAFLLALASLTTALLSACGGNEGAEAPIGPPVDGGADQLVTDDDASTDSDFVLDTSSGCVTGDSCGDGGAGVCLADGTCCDRARACGSLCCAGGNVCSFGKCVTPGVVCVDATDCSADEMCDYALGPATPSGDAGVDASSDGSSDASSDAAACVGGAELKKGRCLPRPPRCAATGGDAGVDGGSSGADSGSGSSGEITCLDKCEYRPPVGKFEPKLKFSWGNALAPSTADSVMMTPIVVQLDDDNCDGVVDERDIPEIVFSTFANGSYNLDGTLHAVSIVGKKVVEKWKVLPSGADPLWPGAHLAGGNIDNKPGNEIVTCTRSSTGGSKVRAYDGKGAVLWTSPAIGYCRVPSLADLDGDGKVEVITETHVLKGATGKILFALASPNNGEVTVADVTGDGVPEIVSPVRIWDNKGVQLADAMSSAVAGGALPGGNFVAVGDFDKDGSPEIVTADFATHTLHVWRYDPKAAGKVRVLRRNTNINGTLSPSLCPTGSAGNTRGGGPPTIADFNGDGTPDVAMAGGVAYGVYDGKKLLDPTVANPTLWLKQTHDCSSAQTGSSVFDFDGDGKAEVIYSDEWYLRIYSGSDGTELFRTCNTTGTLQEYPVIADVDNDGHADIVVASNSYSTITCPEGGTKQAGIRIFGDTEGKWVRTRRIWNQHTYHVTNVLEDGTIPAFEAPNWKQPRLNNFRQNVQPIGEFSAPDLIVSVRPSCEGAYAIIARVRNVGEAAVEAPVDVGLYAGTTLLGKGATSKTLYPAEAEDIAFTFTTVPPGVVDGTQKVHAVVDDGAPPHPWHECRTDNNKSAEVGARCAGPK